MEPGGVVTGERGQAHSGIVLESIDEMQRYILFASNKEHVPVYWRTRDAGGQDVKQAGIEVAMGVILQPGFHIMLVVMSSDQPASERGCLLMVNVAR